MYFGRNCAILRMAGVVLGVLRESLMKLFTIGIRERSTAASSSNTMAEFHDFINYSTLPLREGDFTSSRSSEVSTCSRMGRFLISEDREELWPDFIPLRNLFTEHVVAS